MRFKHRLIILSFEIVFILYVFVCFKYPSCEEYHIITEDEKLLDKFKVPFVDELMWREEFDKRKVESFQMQFKDMEIDYHFHTNYENNCSGNSSVAHRFILGSTWNATIREANKQEAIRYKDLIITNLRDSYLNGTLKAYALLQWQRHYCPDTEYLLKADDDTVIDIPRLQYFIEKDFKALSTKYNNMAIFCNVIQHALPVRIRNKKWYVPNKIWKSCVYPDYCNGAFYLLTSKAVAAIIDETPRHNMIYIEDIMFSGIVAEAAGVILVQEKKHFDRGKRKLANFGCDENKIPYLTAIYEEGNDDITYEKGKRNKFTDSTERLASLSCP